MIFVPNKLHLSTLTAGLWLLAGCVVTATRDTSRKQQLITALEHELQTNTGWIQIHAADALVDHGQKKTVTEFFAPLAAQPPATFRVGVWRVLARSADSQSNRKVFIEKIRSVLRDPQAPDRLSAAETLAKMGVADVADKDVLQQWLRTADEAAAPFVHWLLVDSTSSSERAAHETALASLLDSKDEIARLRAGAALGRIDSLSDTSLQRLYAQISREPADSIARVYIIAANLRHGSHSAKHDADLKNLLLPYLNGKANEQLEAGTVLGLAGDEGSRAALTARLTSPDADGRIGAASGLLYLLQ